MRSPGEQRGDAPAVGARAPVDTGGATRSQASAVLVLQGSAGNRAVSRMLAAGLPVQRDPPVADPAAAEEARIAALEADYWRSLAAGDWRKVALDLNGYNDSDILGKLILLTHEQLVAVAAAARHAMPGWSQRVVTPLASIDAEADRVGRLTYDYEVALAARNWDQAIVCLNGFNDNDIVAKLTALAWADLGHMRDAARDTPVGGGRMARLTSAVRGQVVETSADEQVGGRVYTVQGGYTWRLRPNAILVEVGMNFQPDSGVTVPTAQWFGFIRSTWNHFTAVNRDDPNEKKQIVFVPFAGAGHDIQVSAGHKRANAGHYYVGNPGNATTIPHEFGHLIGLEDEYERDAADFQRVTGGASTAGSGQTALGQQIAREIHTALFLQESLWEWHTTAERRRMAAVNQVLANHHIAANYQAGRTALTAEVANQYRALFGEMSRDFMSRVDTNNDEFNGWREQVLGTFQFTSTSIMGDKSDHTHPVQARHVRAFATHIRNALGRGRWEPVEDH